MSKSASIQEESIAKTFGALIKKCHTTSKEEVATIGHLDTSISVMRNTLLSQVVCRVFLKSKITFRDFMFSIVLPVVLVLAWELI